MACLNDSEFGSEDEDAEFALYAKLYFGPNEDLTKDESHAKIGNPKGEISDNLMHTSQNGLQGIMEQRIQEAPSSVAYRATIENCATQNVTPVITGLGNSCGPNLFVTQPLSKADCKSVLKEKSVNIWPRSKRKREESVCSVESISGKVPLDNLYCNVMDSFSEEEMDAVNALDQKAIVDTVRKSKICKVKKPLCSKDSSDDEDSRCKKLGSLSRKKRKALKKLLDFSDQSDVSDSVDATSADKNGQSISRQSSNRSCDNSGKIKVKKRKKFDIIFLDSSDSDADVVSISPPPNKRMTEHIVNVDKVMTTSCTDQDGGGPLQPSSTANHYSSSKYNGRVVVTGMNESHHSHVLRPELEKHCDSIVATSDKNGQSISGQSSNRSCDNSEKIKVKKKKRNKKKFDVIFLDSSDSDELIGNAEKVMTTSCMDQGGDDALQPSSTANHFSSSKHNERVVVTGMNESFGSHVLRPELEKHCATKRNYMEVLSMALSSSESDGNDMDKWPSAPKLVMNFNNMLPIEDGLNFAPSKDCKVESYFTNQVKSVQSCDFTKGRPPTQRVPSCSKWTREMSSFYDSDISDYFDIEEIHDRQSAVKSDWKIDRSDCDIGLSRRFRYFNQQPRCRRCRQFGHTVGDCPRVPHCFLCSETSHIYRDKCPSNCCFRCGGPYHSFCSATSFAVRCQLCGAKGHMKAACPDLWRRYHATITGSVPVKPVSSQKELRRYCCICAQRGHFAFQCFHGPRMRLPYIVQQQTAFAYSKPVVEVNGKLFVNTKDTETWAPYSLSQNAVERLQVEEPLEEEPVEQEPLNPEGPGVLASMMINRSRDHIISTLQNRLHYYSKLFTKLPELPAAVDVLKKHLKLKTIRRRATPELKRSLILTSLLIQGHLKYGSGQNVVSFLHLVQDLQPGTELPKKLVKDIVESLGMIDNPRFTNRRKILRFAQAYLQTKRDQPNDYHCDLSIKSNTLVNKSQEINTGNQNAIKYLQNDAQLALNKCSGKGSGISEVANESAHKKIKRKVVTTKKKRVKNTESKNAKKYVNDCGSEYATETVRKKKKMPPKKKKLSTIQLGRLEGNGNPNDIVEGLKSRVEKRRAKRKRRSQSESGVSGIAEYSKAKRRRKVVSSEGKQNPIPQREKRKRKSTKSLGIEKTSWFSKALKKT